MTFQPNEMMLEAFDRLQQRNWGGFVALSTILHCNYCCEPYVYDKGLKTLVDFALGVYILENVLRTGKYHAH